MTTMFKVQVTGFVNEFFIGNNAEINAYLLALKDRQQRQIEDLDLKWYNKEMPLFKKSMVFTSVQPTKYHILVVKYLNPNYKMLKFREKYEKFGLNIKITRV